MINNFDGVKIQHTLMSRIWVFRTSVSSKKHIEKLKPLFNKIFKKEEQWNFDLEDREHILKVKGYHITAREIIRTVQSAGYFCEELED